MQLPCPLVEWRKYSRPITEVIHDGKMMDQVNFVCDSVPKILTTSRPKSQELREQIQVVAEFQQGIYRLPVYQMTFPDNTAFTMRCDFSEWLISVFSPLEIDVDFAGLFNPSVDLSIARSFEGFPRDSVFGPYSRNKRQFTFKLDPGYYHLFTFFWLYAYHVLGIDKTH